MSEKPYKEKTVLKNATEQRLPPDMSRVVSVRVYFYKYDIGKVKLVWGVNDWKAVTESLWPDNTTLDEKGVLWTEMKNS